MPKYSLEQLRSKVWVKQEQAIRDLKASGMPVRGSDYELREGATGWQMMPLDDVAQVEPAPREQRVIDALRKKPGAKPKGAPEVILAAVKAAPAKQQAKSPIVWDEADADAKADSPAKKAAAKSRKSPDKATAPPAPASPAPEPVVAPAPETEPAPFDLSPAPNEGGPYELVLREVDGAFAAHSSIASALTISRKLKAVVHVRNASNQLVRVIDAPAYDRYLAERRKAGAKRTGGGKRDPAKPSKFSRIIALLSRDEGATAAQLGAESGWQIGQRHINRAAKLSQRESEKLGEGHWRLKKA